MPRPPDNYTHSQFETISSDHQGETVQCVHCRNWAGSIKTLNRKKAHLLNCPQYLQWRAAGNGQDLAPPNKYQKRDSLALSVWDTQDAGSGFDSSPFSGDHHHPVVGRNKNFDLSKYFDESWDDSSTKKCMRVRCLYCGFSRAKNTTRQVEHLVQCQPFLASTEGQAATSNGDLQTTPNSTARPSHPVGRDVWRGGAPNPNFQIPERSAGLNASSRMPPPPPPARPAPSLVSHLLNKWPEKLSKAAQQQFLSHAGCGTLSAGALTQWLSQNNHVSRAMIGFIGCLIGKVRLSDTSHSKSNTQFRALDLLISTVSNLRKEIDFIENTRRKYALHPEGEPPSPITRAYMDLLASASDSRSSLLEGMVALWATEHCYCVSWQYASTFASAVPPSNYSIPSYLTSSPADPYDNEATTARPTNGSDQHICALQEALIPNWTSREFKNFVDACRAIVNELANAETTGSGHEQLIRCESQYQQVLFLWERLWPEVDGMGQIAELEEANSSSIPVQSNSHSSTSTRPAGDVNGNANASGKPDPIELDDDDDDEDDDDDSNEDQNDDSATPNNNSPFGGTGLDAVAAANQAG